MAFLFLALACDKAAPPREIVQSDPPPPVAEEPSEIEDAAVGQDRRLTPRRVTLGAGGDVLTHLRVIAASRDQAAHGGFDRVLEGLRETITPAEIAFANIESPMVDDVVEMKTGTPPILGSPPDMVEALARAGVDVAQLANNHAYDQRAIGLARSRTHFEAAGVVTVGAGASLDEAFAHRIVVRDGVRVAYVGFTQMVNGRAGEQPPPAELARLDEVERVENAIRRARSDADIVVVGVHWSQDFVMEPSIRQRRLARRFVELGADVIFGSGPHVLQGVERMESARGDAVCAYSLGNLVSNQGLRYRIGRADREVIFPAVLEPRTRDGAWLRVTVELDAAGRVHIPTLEAEPLWTDNNYLRDVEGPEEGVDIRVLRLSAMERTIIDERRPIIAETLGDQVRLAH